MRTVRRLFLAAILTTTALQAGCDKGLPRMKGQPTDPSSPEGAVKLPGGRTKPVGK
jgi:hypothetical protein